MFIAKQQRCQVYVLKIHSSRLRRAEWDLNISLADARNNDELVSLSNSQVLDFIDEINNTKNSDIVAKKIKNRIKTLTEQPYSVKNKKEIRRLYKELDKVQYKPDYLCLVADNKSDFRRACRGFVVNGIRYVRLLGTNGGVKNSTVVFVSERVAPELKRRLENGRDPNHLLVPAKYEAYKALACSGTTPVSMPRGILVVNDCVTHFKEDVISITDEGCDEPVVTSETNVDIELIDSDGYGLMLPSLAERWSKDLGLDYLVAGVNTRFAFEKGCVFTFDFIDFAEKVAGGYIVKDAWGDEVDIRNVDLILTTSMAKLWDSYSNCKAYVENSVENGYTFRVAKTCPRELENERRLNYQFIQSFKLNENDIDELIAPTVHEIEDILSGDYRKTILFLRGMYLNENNINDMPDDFVKALMIDKRTLNDQFVRKRVYQMIKKRINEAKVGVLNIHGNYSIVCGDPYSLCQSIFGLKVTGLLEAGQVYNKFWADVGADKLICFRAPMTAHNNIRLVRPANTEAMKYWYRYMNTCTLMNSWDSAAHALNGMDKDGDLVLLTDNNVLVRRFEKLSTIMCIQRRADKKVVTEDDLIQANINGFGDDIGKITNRITSMFEVRSHFDESSKEYKELDYRIKSGQLQQQNCIDKTKGIISKPMPKSWYNRNAVRDMDTSTHDNKTRQQLYAHILADRKPYFMTYIYSDLRQRYNKYIKNARKKCVREFGIDIDALSAKEYKTREEKAFIEYYHSRMPVGMGNCVMNIICHKIEQRFDEYMKLHSSKGNFDYGILKYHVGYPVQVFNAVDRIYKRYTARVRSYMQYVKDFHVNADCASESKSIMTANFVRECRCVCPNRKQLCDILLDICYRSNSSKQFVWDICGSELIESLLEKNYRTIRFPTMDDNGDIKFKGKRFRLCNITIGGDAQSV